MVLFMNKEETPQISRMSHKSIREKERRDEINNRINELRGFVCEDELERKTLKQADVLIRTVDLVHRMESEQPGPSYNPDRKGFVDGFNSVEGQVSQFIRALGMDSQITQDFIVNLKKCFDQERNSLMMNNSPKSSGGGAIRSKYSPESNRSTPSPYNSKMDRKEIKKNREQDRRDRQGEAIESLKQFLISISGGNLRSQVEKMQRLNTLENIIEYIRNKKTAGNFNAKSTHDQTLYSHAWNGGFEIAKRTALDFFRKDRHLYVRTAALEQHIMSNYRVPTALPMPALQLPNILPFFAQSFPTQFPALSSPTYSLDSPPSDTSMESGTSTQLWRPWE